MAEFVNKDMLKRMRLSRKIVAVPFAKIEFAIRAILALWGCKPNGK
jgi:hypothetical protein